MPKKSRKSFKSWKSWKSWKNDPHPVVPEPRNYGLFMAGMIALAWLFRRRGRQ